MNRTISTLAGRLKLMPASTELIERMRSLLPFGLIKFADPQHGAEYGIVMQRGQEELLAVKQQPPDCSQSEAIEILSTNSLLIAHSLSAYLRRGFTGLLMPCPYLRLKPGGRAESGIAYFGFPSPTGPEAADPLGEPAFDSQFCRGFTAMMVAFIEALRESSARTGLSLQPCIGLELRRWQELGKLVLGFAAVGQEVVCLKTSISEEDIAWSELRSSGMEAISALQSLPIAGPSIHDNTAEMECLNDTTPL